MAEAVVDRFEVVDVDDQEAERLGHSQAGCNGGFAVAVETSPVQQAGESVAADMLDQRLIALAIGQRVEDVGQSARRRDLPRLEPSDIGDKHDAVGKRRAHLGKPAAEENRDRRAGDEMQRGEKSSLVEREHAGDGDQDARKQRLAKITPKLFVEQDDQDGVDEEQNRAPHHQPAHLVDEADVGKPAIGKRCDLMQAQDQHEPDHQGIAEQQAVDGLPDGRRILLDVEQQEHHQLAGKQHGGTW